MDSPSVSVDGRPGSRSIRQWVEDRRVLAALEARELAASGITPAESFNTALKLLTFYTSVHGWPPASDPVDEREDREVWERFARLRRKLLT